MSLDTYIRQVIREEVRTVVREELAEVLGEMKDLQQSREANQQSRMPKKYIIRPNELSKMLSISVPTLYRMDKEGYLPEKVQFGPRAVGWYNTDIEEWLEQSKRQKGV